MIIRYVMLDGYLSDYSTLSLSNIQSTSVKSTSTQPISVQPTSTQPISVQSTSTQPTSINPVPTQARFTQPTTQLITIKTPYSNININKGQKYTIESIDALDINTLNIFATQFGLKAGSCFNKAGSCFNKVGSCFSKVGSCFSKAEILPN